MSIRIVADSSADLLELEQVEFVSVPLTVRVGNQEFRDDANVDLRALDELLQRCPEQVTTACPGVGEWLEAFGEAETIFCVTIASTMSGSLQACRAAKQEYEQLHPERKVYLVDSLSIGPEMVLLVERIRDLALCGMPPEYIYRSVQNYQKRTQLLFALNRLHNCAGAGRAGRGAAQGVGVMGVRAIGKASEQGQLEIMEKCRGRKRSIASLVEHMKELGYAGGRILIAHHDNEAEANDLVQRIRQSFGAVDVRVQTTRALCGFYAEKGSFLVGMEC